MNNVTNVSRRKFLKGSAATGSLVLGYQFVPTTGFAATSKGDGVLAPSKMLEPNLFVSIDTSGTVTIVAHRSEMGQGVRTSVPMILADELEADWDRVVIKQAVGDKKFGSQYTDGSRSIRHNYQRMREFGAATRQMLEQAAANKWGVPLSAVKADNHKVKHSSGKSLDFGELVEIAAGLPVPDVKNVKLKDPKEFRYIGKDMLIVDGPDIATGKAVYGIDVKLPDMKFASVEHCPVTYGTVKSIDDAQALKVPGVEKVMEIPQTQKPIGFNTLGGVAVIANTTWAAFEGRKKLKIEWEYGENSSYDSGNYRKSLEDTARKPGRIVRENGDVKNAFETADKTIESEFYVPHVAHATMEPPCGTAWVQSGQCEVWAPAQDPQAVRSTVAGAIGFDEANVSVQVPLLGGAFGRKSKPDYAAEAAIISKEIGAPVKVTWTREDDIRHGYYHSVSAQYLKAGVDKDGKPVAWQQRSVFPTIWSTFEKDATQAHQIELSLGLLDLPYDIPNICLENGEAKAHVRIGWLRSVCNIYHAFATNTMANELAEAVGKDPLEYLLTLIGEPRILDVKWKGVEYWNYDQTYEEYPIDTGRLANVLKLAAEKSGYGKSLPAREGIGLAVHRSFTTYVATAVHATVSKDGKVSIPRVDMAVDAGQVVNPDRVRSQMEGSTIYGMSAACYNEITAKDGIVEQSNFHDYKVVRMADAPGEINVHIVDSDAAPGGVGEPGTPPFAPALTNAIYVATGKRIRSLPLQNHDLSA